MDFFFVVQLFLCRGVFHQFELDFFNLGQLMANAFFNSEILF
jgi:hypothetical protein